MITKINQSTLDRFVRIIVGGIFLLLASYIKMNGLLTWILVVLGILLMLTGLAGVSLIYSLLNIRTNK